MKNKIVWPGSTQLAPVPVVLVGCGNGEDIPYNLITVAWAGTVCSDPAMLSVSIRPERHSYDIMMVGSGLLWVTMSYYEQSDIINKNILTHRNPSELITRTLPSTTTQFLRRRLQMQRSAKIPTMGCTWRTAHCRDFLLAAADVCLIVRNYFTSSNSTSSGCACCCSAPGLAP